MVKMLVILDLPDLVLNKILSYFSYDELSHLRIVCKQFDDIGQQKLNRGFSLVEQYHMKCLKKIKSQLPRRESERRNHALSRHADVLTAVETRMSLLSMTYRKYIESRLCCFIPGKVIDEIMKVLIIVDQNLVLPRANEILQELRDISSMAMEHFEEHIVPQLKEKCGRSPSPFQQALVGLHTSSITGNFCSTSMSTPSPSTADMKNKIMDLFSRTANIVARRQFAFLKSRVRALHAKTVKQEKNQSEQTARITELEAKLSEQDVKLNEFTKKLLEYDEKFDQLTSKLNSVTHSSPILPLIDRTDDGGPKEFILRTKSQRKRKGEPIETSNKRKKL